MRSSGKISSLLLAMLIALPSAAQSKENQVILWHDVGDVSRLDMVNGPGGAAHQPGNHFKFLKESFNGTAPKFEVEDENGVHWKVKLGPEVRSETATTRLVWAAGYFVDEDYYRPQIEVSGLPHLSRGEKFVHNGNTVVGVRLERHHSGPEPVEWSWFENAFANTREFNALRALMALINNWDLKEANNAVYIEPAGHVYAVADLGGSLGKTGDGLHRSKGVAQDFEKSQFIQKSDGKYVDFVMHSRPFFLELLFNPAYYRMRSNIEKIPKHIPVGDARWLGERLSQLSTNQIADCFRASGFSPQEVDTYSRALTRRIAALKDL